MAAHARTDSPSCTHTHDLFRFNTVLERRRRDDHSFQMPKNKKRMECDVEGRVKKRRKSANRSSADPLDTSDEYWRALCPNLHVNDTSFKESCKPLRLPEEIVSRCRRQLLEEAAQLA